MQTLRECVHDAAAQHRALGHFNISDSNQLDAIARASIQTGIPAIIGLSEGERAYFPLTHAKALIDSYRKEGVPLYLNADHTYTIEKVHEAIASCVDSVVVDGAQLPFEDNIMLLSAAVASARGSNRDILVEGELGYIGTSSSVMDTIPEGAAITEDMMTKPDELQTLVSRSGIDAVAPAVGNIHGIVTSGQPALSIDRIAILAEHAGVPLVLHGGSGSSDEEFVAAIRAGIAIIHINTDLRVLYKNGLIRELGKEGGQVAPYKFLSPVVVDMTNYVAQKMQLFWSV